MAEPSMSAWIALSNPYQEALWRSVLRAHGLRADRLGGAESVRQYFHWEPGADSANLLVADVRRLANERLDLQTLASGVLERNPRTRFLVTMDARLEVSTPQRRFAQHMGALDLLPMIVPGSERSADIMSQGLASAGIVPREGPLREALERVHHPDVPAALALFREHGTTPDDVAARMRGRGGVSRRDRRHAAQVYADCFVGSEAVVWLGRACGLDRRQAFEAGQFLLQHGVFDHVVREHPFRDENYFYRFCATSPAIDAIDLDELIRRMWSRRDGLTIASRPYLGKTYESCFVGSEAVDWMVASHRLSREEAVTLGQFLVDLGIVHHVVDEHAFTDGNFFFRFRRHELA